MSCACMHISACMWMHFWGGQLLQLNGSDGGLTAITGLQIQHVCASGSAIGTDGS